MHGIAININSDLKHFQRIVPCGIDPTKGGVCRLQDLVNAKNGSNEIIDMNVFTNVVLSSFKDVFNLELIHSSTPIEEIEKLANLYPSIANSTLKTPSSDI